MGELTENYRNNSLRANPDKTKVTAFHLRNREAKRSLKVAWYGVDLEHTTHPKYLGVTLDRMLCCKQHIQNTKMKVAARNNLLNKLAYSEWGTNASTIRKTGCLMPTYVEDLYLLAGIAPPDIRRDECLEWNEPNKWNRRLIPCLGSRLKS